MLHEQRLRVNELKTVPLFDLAVRAGIALADLNDSERSMLLAFGREYGLAFQMADDIADGDETDVTPFENCVSRARACLAGFGKNAGSLRSMLTDLEERALGPRPVVS
jgi:hypothetical protein